MLFKVNNRPRGEKSANLVTLLATKELQPSFFFFLSISAKDLTSS
jgi:hypothetical protein